MLALGIITTITSLATYTLCIFVFGGIAEDPKFRKWVFSSFIVKAVTWSPFLGHEMYDLIFEQLYHDVEFQLNIIKPGGGSSRTVSPEQTAKKTSRLTEIAE